MDEAEARELSLFDQAIMFATKAHTGITRKGSTVPYIVHPLEVAAIAATITTDEEILAAAVLHDVLEDTDTTPEELGIVFGPRILCLVRDETEDKRRELPPEVTWRQRKEETIRFLREEASWEAKVLALSDKLSNMRAVYRDMQQVGDKLWERFHQKDRNMHAWMYRSVLEALSDLDQYIVWQEYRWLVEAAFGKDT
ncbi:MAG: bifunctional (p)ppGpp synthetase/guanosine-3',5'-bis(diphosphate) 3'-pyrophosphohydrolase [Lachnospiraceae bacterium]|nr:bifunctional (p)ppGpp synthetase/guanosine-3',5'-bis(diphosphate) 3'-pyrophosphohydrolase [Lachnospiraceae bacterium]